MNKKFDASTYYCNTANRTDNNAQIRISYLRAIKAKSVEIDANLNLARFLTEDKIYKQAEFRYRKASIIKPSTASIYNEWALLLYKQGILEGQEELFRKVIELHPNSSDGLSNLGAVLIEKCKFEEAMVVLEKVLDSRPYHAMSLNNLASVYLNLGRYDKTIEKLQKALETDGDHLLAHINLGLVESCLGKDDEAKENYKKVLDLLGENSDLKEAVLRSCKRLLNFTKEGLLGEGTDEEKRSHNERFRKALGEFLPLLEQ